MAISAGGGGIETPMSEINTTPLVDVMLVLLIIFLIAIPVAIQEVDQMELPVLPTTETENKVENLLLTVTTTDGAGLNAGDDGYTGAIRSGECRVYFGNITPVDSTTLYDDAALRLKNIVEAAGGIDAIMANPEMIPQVHIRGDVDAPWRCIAGTIFNIQAAGYPTVGFISNPQEPAS